MNNSPVSSISFRPNMSEFVFSNSNTNPVLNKVNIDNKDEFVSQKDNTTTNNINYRKLIIGLTCSGVGALLISPIFLKRKLFFPAKFAEHINFSPAQSMEEAIEFAKKNFKIKTFDFKDDLGMANWVNAALTNVNNRFKGKAHIPPIFRWATSTEVGKKTKTWGKGVIAWTDSFSKANNSIIFNPNNIGSKIGFVKGAGKNAYDVLNHELGHYLHSMNISEFDNLLGRLSSRKTKLFKNNKEQQSVAAKISGYAKTNPREFVAECFSYMCAGNKLPEDVFKLYKHYKGPTIPNM